jgi:hypothetical protein
MTLISRVLIISILPLVLGSRPLPAQVDCVSPAPIQVAHVRGQVFDFSGTPVPGAPLSLSTPGEKSSQTTTNAKGNFDFHVHAGTYVLESQLGPLEAKNIELIVGKDLVNSIHPKELIVILGLRYSFCSWATTSHREFKDEISSNNKRIEEAAKKNATQK